MAETSISTPPPALRLHLPVGKLSSCECIDPREVELDQLREVAADMKQETDEAKERLARAELDYADFIRKLEATYKGDVEGVEWLRKMLSEEQVEEALLLEKDKAAFKEDEARYIAEKEDIRREIRTCDKKLEEMKKKGAKKAQGKAIRTMAGLVYIHNRDMAHGDLKPMNIMVSDEGVAMIADFGNTILKDVALGFEPTTTFGATYQYALPEHLTAENAAAAAATKQSGVYSYGM
ncbi:unnamed protein product, partial [Rhizoctonia solani]